MEGAVVLAFVAVGMLTAAEEDGQEGVDYATFEASRLCCVIGNNGAKGEHRRCYNGLFRLWSPDQEQTPFVPFYAGWNLEHYFDARPRHDDAKVFFEPRWAPMDFRRVDDRTAELVQPETPFWGVQSRTRFEVKDPYYIDMTFRCTAHKALEGGFLGCFWASYINAPDNKGLYFLDAGSSLDQPRWVQFCTQQHDRDSTVLPEGDDASVEFIDGGLTLYNSLSPLRYGVPFYYGRVRNMVLIFIFEPSARIRFTHSPSGGGRTPQGDDTNPAWDFQFIVPEVELHREYGFRARLVYKPWVDRADVLAEARRGFEALTSHEP